MNENDNSISRLLSVELREDCSDKELWEAWKVELAAVASRMPKFKTMRYQALQSIAAEKLEEIQLLKANKTN